MYASGEYFTIDQSLKFNDDDTAYLSRTFTASNRKTWTFSTWIKRNNLCANAASGYQDILMSPDNTYFTFSDDNEDALRLFSHDSGAVKLQLVTKRLFRDTSAWMHFMFVLDTTQGTDTNRFKLYINGVEETEFESSANNYSKTYPPQNYDAHINMAGVHKIGYNNKADYYMAETHFIDGTAKTPADFGETGDYGEWKPKEYSGSYGTNGFYLPFKQDYEVEGFSTTLYKGTGASQYIGGVGFSPDLLWMKSRSSSQNHRLIDSVRGSTETLKPDITAAGIATSLQLATDGWNFTGNVEAANDSGTTYVGWAWDMGANSASTGFMSAVYTGNGGISAVGNLGFQPDLVWILSLIHI